MADNENVIGLAMQLDVTDLKTGVKEANKIIASSKKEFANATAGMDMWTQSSEGLTAKLSQLGKQLDAQERIAKGYEAEIARASAQEGDHSAELEKLKEKLQDAQNAVKKTQSQMSHYSSSLSEVQKKEKQANSALGKLTATIDKQKSQLADLTHEYKSAVIQYGKNSAQAKELANKIKELSGEISDNEQQVEDSERAYEGLGKTVGEVGIQVVEKTTKAFAALGASLAGLFTAFLATAEGTRELRNNLAKVDTAFSESEFSAQQAETTFKDFFGILGDDGQTTEAVSHLAALAKSQEDLTKWTNISAGVVGKFGDSLPIESLTEAANETAKTGEVAGSLADALNWAGVSQEKFQSSLDECNTEQERNQLITKTLNDLYGEAGKTYKENNKDIIAQNEAQLELNKTLAEVGKMAEPVLTQLKEIGAELAKTMLPILEKLIPFVKENFPIIATLAGSLLAVIGAMNAAVKISKLVTMAQNAQLIIQAGLLQASTMATKAQAAAQWLLNAAMSANPIGLVIAAIAALVAALVLLYKNSETFRKKWDEIWAAVKETATKVIDSVVKFFSEAWDKIKDAWRGAGKFFSNLWEGIKKAFSNVKTGISDKFAKAWESVKGAWDGAAKWFKDLTSKVANAFKGIPKDIKSYFASAWENVKGAWGKVADFFGKVISTIVDAFKNLPTKMKSVGKNLVEGLWNGVNDMTSWVVGKIKGFGESVLGGIKDFFGIHSPSTVMAEVGANMGEGLVEGLDEKTADAENAGKNAGNAYTKGFGDTATGNLKASVSQIDGAFSNLTSKIDRQKTTLARLESEYKSAVMTFGSSSAQANALGRQIVALSRNIEENELKVKDLNDSYQNLNGTLSTQMRVDLNNAKNRAKSLQAEVQKFRELASAAEDAGEVAKARDYEYSLERARKELDSTNATVRELTANLDYLAKQEAKRDAERRKSLQVTKEVAVETQKELNAYEQLVAKIKEEKATLEGLKSAYSSALLEGNADAAGELAGEIRNLSTEITQNEEKVEELKQAYENLFAKSSAPEVGQVKAGWQTFIDKCEDALGISEDKLQKWSEGAGKYVSKIANAFDSVGSHAKTAMGLISDYMSAAFQNETNEINDEIDKITKAKDAELAKVKEVKDAELAKIQETKAAELASVQSEADEEFSALDRLYDDMLISATEYRKRRTEIANTLQKQQEEINARTLENETNANNERINLENELNAEKERQLNELNEKKNEIAEKQFDAEQKNQIATAVINGAAAIVKGYAQLGPIGGSINAAVQAGITAAQIKIIKMQKFVPQLAKGGIVDEATYAMIGENGREAIMPLEKNTGWIEELAAKLNSFMQRDVLGGISAPQTMPAYATAGGGVVNNYTQIINAPKQPSRHELYRDTRNLLTLKG